MFASMSLEEFCKEYIAGNLEITIKKNNDVIEGKLVAPEETQSEEIQTPQVEEPQQPQVEESQKPEEKEDEFPLETVHVSNNCVTKLEYFPGTKKVHRRRTYNVNKLLHSFDGEPAEMIYNEDGTIKSITWYINGVIGHPNGDCSFAIYNDSRTTVTKHYKKGDKYVIRDDKKPNIEVIECGVIKREEWLNEEGKLHREIPEGPARIDYIDGKKVKQTFCLRGGKEFVYNVKPEAQ